MWVPKVCPKGTEGDPTDLIGVIGCLYKLIYLKHNLLWLDIISFKIYIVSIR
jgi:hypothetical protein